MNSMERRLQIGLGLLLLLLTSLFWVMINRSIHGLVEDIVIARLQHDAEHMINALDPSPIHTRIGWRRVNPIYNKVNSGHYYTIQFKDGRHLSSPSLWDKQIEVKTIPANKAIRYRTAGPQQQQLLVWAKSFEKAGHRFVLAVGEDLSPIKAQRERFKQNFALLALAAFVLLLLLQSFLIRRSFKRLDRVQAEFGLLQVGKVERLTTDVPSEVEPLVKSFNALLQQMSERLGRSRNALGNLAHALKGPLNLLKQMIDSDQPLDRKEAHRQTDRIHQLIDRELKRARLAGAGASAQRFDAGAELPDLVGVLNQLHQHRQLQIELQIDPQLQPFADREDMLELIGNILDNGCKWAQEKLSCRLKLENNEVHIVVEDDGKGLQPQQLAQLADRGVRLDESVEGSGLGLAIAKDIVSLYGGELTFTLSKTLGGLRVEIRLPLNN